MLTKLKQKAPTAKLIQADILEYSSQEKYDYIFISSGSVSLFTNIEVCLKILEKLKTTTDVDYILKTFANME